MKQLAGILIFSLFVLSQLFAQQYRFSTYSLEEGLSQSVVICIFQDSKGYIWLGTQNGLNRFDGENFELFRFDPSDSTSISNNWIYSISEDLDGDLWIGTKGGLHHYRRSENSFSRIQYQPDYQFDVSNYCYDNICLQDGSILFNTPPLVSIFNPKQDSFVHFQTAFEYNSTVQDVRIPVIEDKSSRIWVGNMSGLASFYPKEGKFTYHTFKAKNGTQFSEAYVTALFQDKNGAIWVGTTGGLYRSGSGVEDFLEVQLIGEDNQPYDFETGIRSISQDKEGKLIVGTERLGLFFLYPVSDVQYRFRNFNEQNSQIGHNIVPSLLIDRSENLWVGTLSGVSKTDLKQKKFTLYRNNNMPDATPLLGNVIAGLFKNDDGILWVGNWGQGLNLFNPENNEVEYFSTQHTGNHFLPNDFVHVITKDSKKNIWLGTRDGVFIYDKPENRFVLWTNYFNKPEFPSFENTRIYQIIQDREGNIWFGSSNGLYKLSHDFSTMEIFHTDEPSQNRLSANLIYSILEDSEGLIWIATINGLDMYNPGTKEIKHFSKANDGLNSDFLISLCEDTQGRIWIGSNAYINIYDKQKARFDFMGKEDGLPSNYIYEIQLDKNNDMWLATGNGLSKFDIKTKKIETYTREDGLQSAEFNIRAACACENGEMLFGGMNGFNTFYPDSIGGNPHIPDIVFTSFVKTTNDVQKWLYIENTDELVLSHRVQSFKIDFAALEFTNPQKNNYAYKMEGISDEWIDIGNRKFVPFFALPPGEYVFRVKGSNNDGVWNTEGVSISIVVLPPWWRSYPAYLSYLIVIVLGIFVFIKLRERKLKLDKVLLEKKVVDRTVQIEEQNRIIISKNEELNELNRTKDKFFSIIGHDLGNHFNIIIGFSEELFSGFRKLDEEKIERHIGNIHRSSMQAHDLLGNLLTWARLQRNKVQFRPEIFDANKKIRELIAFHEEAAFNKNILIDVFTRNKVEVNADINMFSTVFRNLLANAIKFTPTDGEISIRSKQNAGFCEITITDNGVGIATENIEKIFRIDGNVSTKGTDGEKGTGLGLILCKEFVEKHNGEIRVESEVGNGSSFVFTMPLFKS